MHIVHVEVHVKPEDVEAFKAAAHDNARHSVQEPGVSRFDVLQRQDDPTRFLLYEVYRSEEDVTRHKETAHYLRWRDAVEPMMAEGRVATRYTNLYPGESGFDSSYDV